MALIVILVTYCTIVLVTLIPARSANNDGDAMRDAMINALFEDGHIGLGQNKLLGLRLRVKRNNVERDNKKENLNPQELQLETSALDTETTTTRPTAAPDQATLAEATTTTTSAATAVTTTEASSPVENNKDVAEDTLDIFPLKLAKDGQMHGTARASHKLHKHHRTHSKRRFPRHHTVKKNLKDITTF